MNKDKIQTLIEQIDACADRVLDIDDDLYQMKLVLRKWLKALKVGKVKA